MTSVPVPPHLPQAPHGGAAIAPWPLRVRAVPAALLLPLPQLLRALTLSLGAVHTWVAATRQSMSEDGINYLDIGDAYMAGDWASALNAIWSPLYPIVIGGVQRLVQPSSGWEFPLVQITNFAVFAAALFAFEFFWREFSLAPGGDSASEGSLRQVAPKLWLTLGYSMFIWSSLVLITVWSVTPDMLVAAFVYLAAGLALRMRRCESPPRTAAALGVVLGVAYFAKAAMFPLGLVLIVVAAAINARPPGGARRLAWMAIPFAFVSGPLVAAMSASSGYLTFGDVGRFTYMKHVNGLEYPHWTDSVQQVTGTPEHPPRLLVERPAVYAFAAPVAGTYPLSFDPGYWTRGLTPRIDAAQQFRAIADNVRFYFDLIVRKQGGFAAVVLLLALVLRTGRRRTPVSAEWAVAAWALCAFGMYAFVYAESRYIAPFVVLLWSGVLGWLRAPEGQTYRRLAVTSAALLILFVWTNIVAFNLEGASALWSRPSGRGQPAETGRFSDGAGDRHPDIADALLRRGVTRGDAVGVIGDSFTAYWARLARVRIVAEVPPGGATDFWTADTATQARVLHAIAAAGAVAVVGIIPAGSPNPPGWQPIGDTSYVVNVLR